jgi:hypothetical protein
VRRCCRWRSANSPPLAMARIRHEAHYRYGFGLARNSISATSVVVRPSQDFPSTFRIMSRGHIPTLRRARVSANL